jgi:hypothetical protein
VETTDMTSGYVSTDAGESWRLFPLGGSPLVFAFDPLSPAVIYAGNAAFWRSEDRARTWRIVFPAPERGTVCHHWSDHGDTVYTTDEPLHPSGNLTRLHAIVVDPAASSRLLIALSSRPIGPPGTTRESEAVLLESRDRGKTWERRASLGAGPVLALWIKKAGTWTPSWTGAPEGAATHVFLEPASPKGQRTLYACIFGRGLYKSRDGGRSWAAKNAGIEGRQPFAWRISRAGDGTLYLVVARRSEAGRIGDADDGALCRSRDGGERWEKMALPPGVNGPNAFTVDPTDPRRLYLSAWPVATPGGDTGAGSS